MPTLKHLQFAKGTSHERIQLPIMILIPKFADRD